MPSASYERSGYELRVIGSLDAPIDVEFDLQTRALVDEAQAAGVLDITIDLRDLEYIGSQYIGALAAVSSDMKKHDGELTVRAKEHIADLILQCGLDRVLSLVVE